MISNTALRMFQIIRFMLDDSGTIVARRALQPLYELRDHAIASPRDEPQVSGGDYGYNDERQCWWASDERGRQCHFVVEEIAQADVAA